MEKREKREMEKMTQIPIFYNPKQTVAGNTSFSPSAGKPVKVLESYLASGIPIEIKDFKPLKRSHMALAHSPAYVAGVMSMRIANGFGNTLKAVAESLPYTTGSFLHAAVYAAQTKSIAVSLTSGFHHACYDSGGGFCTMNGLMIAAQFLTLNGLSKVGILDMDQHSGNGQENIIKTLNVKNVVHWSLGYNGPSRSGAEKFFAEEFSEVLKKFKGVSVMLYQAGADPWVNDPLGGRLTKEQLRLRDQMVFEFCKENKIGIVYNLAGGYADAFQNVLDIHLNTLIEAAKVYLGVDASHLTNVDDGSVKQEFSWNSGLDSEDHDEPAPKPSFYGVRESKCPVGKWKEVDPIQAEPTGYREEDLLLEETDDSAELDLMLKHYLLK